MIRKVFIHPYAYPNVPVYENYEVRLMLDIKKRRIIEAVVQYFKVPKKTLFNLPSRRQDLIYARQVLIYFYIVKLELHPVDIAQEFGITRSNVINGHKHFKGRAQFDHTVRLDLRRIDEVIKKEK